MLIKNLVNHQWKSFIRNNRWRRNVLSKIIYGIMILNVIFLFTLLGIYIGSILGSIGTNKVYIFNSFLLWYIGIDLLLRCLFQPLPTVKVIPYLRFRIRRNTIIYYLLFRSFGNLFNIIPWLVIIPFSIQILLPQYGNLFTVFYLVGILLIVILNNYLAVLIGFLSKKNILYFLIPFLIITSIEFFQKVGYDIYNISAAMGQSLLHANFLLILLLIVLIFTVLIGTKHILLSNFYVDNLQGKKEIILPYRIAGIDIRGNFGEIVRYLSLEMSLLLRNKRPRQMLSTLPLFLVYFIYMIFNESNTSKHQVLFLIMLSVINVFGSALYGQFIFSWESSYFDGIMSRKNNFLNYIKAKYYLMILITLVTFIPLMGMFIIIGKIDLLLFFSIFLFIIGVVFFIILLWSTYNDGRIELSAAHYFNYSTMKGNQFLLSSIAILLPIGLYLLFKYLFNDAVGKIAIALPGLILIFFHERWIKKIIIPCFYFRKYKNLEGYRKFEI